jgi:hypothetical protein
MECAIAGLMYWIGRNESNDDSSFLDAFTSYSWPDLVILVFAVFVCVPYRLLLRGLLRINATLGVVIGAILTTGSLLTIILLNLVLCKFSSMLWLCTMIFALFLDIIVAQSLIALIRAFYVLRSGDD